MTADSKIHLGQFYTQTNPFVHPRFQQWLNSIPKLGSRRFLEPFGGANNIVKMILDIESRISEKNWSSFDIQPQAQAENRVPQVKVSRRDCIRSFPLGYDVAVTNPPYLAKNSATRKGAKIDFENFGDLFELSLSRTLQSCPWVAAIIPESFITRELFQDRLEFVISLNEPMFDDTEFPVCLAVFSPEATADFELWIGDEFIGLYSQLKSQQRKLDAARKVKAVFNDPNGILGLRAIDSTKGASIEFVPGVDVPSSRIRNTSRSLTRITFPGLKAKDLDKFIEIANKELRTYRNATKDVFLTSFKGLRQDGRYRRRLDWSTSSKILNLAFVKLTKNSK